MRRESPSKPPSPRARRGFTLPETLGVIAVFALIAGLVAADFDALPEAFRHRSPEDMARVIRQSC